VVFSFFDATSAKQFGGELAHYYMERMPLEADLKQKTFALKSLKTLDQMELRVKAYKQKNKLNFYQIAQMGNAFKWALKDAGYSDAYNDKLTQWLVIAVKS
jgi:hypothetical protein